MDIVRNILKSVENTLNEMQHGVKSEGSTQEYLLKYILEKSVTENRKIYLRFSKRY